MSAFEQSLSNMTQRLQQLTATAERKVNIFRKQLKNLNPSSKAIMCENEDDIGYRSEGLKGYPFYLLNTSNVLYDDYYVHIRYCIHELTMYELLVLNTGFLCTGFRVDRSAANNRIASEAVDPGWSDDGAYAVYGNSRRWC